MPRVATYVFTAIVSTGSFLNNREIIELSMVAVRRRHILDTTQQAVTLRVQEKLTLCLNTSKFIDYDLTMSGMTDLDCGLLKHQSCFNINVFNIINCFLQGFEKPVCLVAYNGHFDGIPILKNHFDELGVSLPDDILCADILHAFYDIFASRRGQDDASKAGPSVVDHKTEVVNTDESASNQNDNNQISDKIVEEKPSSGRKECDDSNVHSEDHNNITKELLLDWLQDDEKSDYLDSEKMQQLNEKTKAVLNSRMIAIRSKTNLFDNEDISQKEYVLYRLPDIYERVLRLPRPETCGAEVDSLMAMQVSVAIAKEFVEWIDNENNQCKFSEMSAFIRKIRTKNHTYRTIKGEREIFAYLRR